MKVDKEIVMIQKTEIQKQNIQMRPPVVVVLGHVDHGKSSILEAIKDFKITAKEAGGITQHIGAYEVEHQGKKITFIDTPGHEVFSAMRSRGAKVADIAVLVVAAEEGVKPQTKEAILHAKKSGIPIIVALNKMDKPEANPERVKRELQTEDVLVESMGGEIPLVEISAKTGKGTSDLLELILLVAEMNGLKGDISLPGEGVVIEAYLDTLRGPTATLILSNGILNRGNIIGTSSSLGRVKVLENFQGKAILKAFPSMPCVAVGFESVPEVGEKFKVYPDIETAKAHLQKPIERPFQAVFIKSDKKVLNLIIKADCLGSLEAIEEVLKNLPQEQIVLRILKAEVGEVNETDLKLAKGAKARVLGFRVKINPVARKLTEREKIKIRVFDVIYELAQGVREMMEKSIESKVVRTDWGKVKVLVIFLTEKNRQIVGGKVIEGEIKKGVRIEVFRGEEKAGSGKLINLQRNKKDIERLTKGQECGILYEGNAKIEEGDILVIYTEERKKSEL